MADGFGRILVTGAAGFIGFHVSRFLLEGREVLGFDNVNDYYDPALKEARLRQLEGRPGFSMVRQSLEDAGAVDEAFERFRPEAVIHLAAQAGVRYSLIRPDAYIQSNLVGFGNILEACRRHEIRHLVFASSSSVYGFNASMPFSVHDNVDHPASLYAATKKANELMAHTYSHLFGIPATGLRFFTVYGPWGRPDMALFLFTQAILEGRPIDVYNNGDMSRDFTYIDDIVEGVVRVADRPAKPNLEWDPMHPDPGSSPAPYRLYNIGNHQAVRLERMIELLEEALGRRAEKNYLPMQPGDVPATFADVADLQRAVGFAPATPIEVGIPRFVEWYRSHYNV